MANRHLLRPRINPRCNLSSRFRSEPAFEKLSQWPIILGRRSHDNAAIHDADSAPRPRVDRGDGNDAMRLASEEDFTAAAKRGTRLEMQLALGDLPHVPLDPSAMSGYEFRRCAFRCPDRQNNYDAGFVCDRQPRSSSAGRPPDRVWRQEPDAIGDHDANRRRLARSLVPDPEERP